MNIPHDSSCHEGSKNVSFIQVRNLEGQNHAGHTVLKDFLRIYRVSTMSLALFEYKVSGKNIH